MAYGENMKLLSPCSDETVISAIEKQGSHFDRILDIGCGRGDRLKALWERYPYATLFGIDTDEENIASARENCPKGEFCCCEARELPFIDGSFDLCLCECSFSLFANPEKCADEMKRVLKPGGLLLLSDICRLKGEGERADGAVVQNVYTAGQLESFFTEKGFTVLDFFDRSGDLVALAAQMIFDGSFCDCLGADTAALLRRIRAGYGMWVFGRK